MSNKALIWSGSMLSKKKSRGKLSLFSLSNKFQYGFNNASDKACAPRAEPPIPRTKTLSNLPSTIAANSLTYQTVSSL